MAFLSSCEIINPEEDVPSYISIKNVDVNSVYAAQGTSSNKINDVWVNVDGDLIGIFELPAKFPVLATGEHEITVRAGIKNNGIAASRIIYPFYTHYVVTKDLEAAQVLELQPEFGYDSETIYAWMEDFDNPGVSLVKTSDSDTNIYQINTDVFEGNYSGAVFLDKQRSLFIAQSIDSFFLPYDNKAIFLELDYKSDLIQNSALTNQFTVGLIADFTGYDVPKPVIYINSTNGEWNKIYVDLTYTVTTNPTANFFRVYFKATLDTTVYNSANILIDNIKLLHYPTDDE